MVLASCGHEEVSYRPRFTTSPAIRKAVLSATRFLYRCGKDPTRISLSPLYYVAFNSLPQHRAPSSVTGMIVFEPLLLAHFLQDTVLLIAHLTLRRL